LFIQIRCINLANVAGEYKLRPVSSPCDDCLYLVRCKVLTLVNNKYDVRKRTSTDICKRSNDNLLFFKHSLELLVLFISIAKGVFNEL